MTPNDLQGLSSVIDSKALLARCLNNLDFAERILILFEDRCAAELAELDQALEKGDVESVGKIAHRMTGACANAAASQLQACAHNLRRASSKQSLSETAACVDELRRELQRFSAALSPHRKTPHVAESVPDSASRRLHPASS